MNSTLPLGVVAGSSSFAIGISREADCISVARVGGGVGTADGENEVVAQVTGRSTRMVFSLLTMTSRVFGAALRLAFAPLLDLAIIGLMSSGSDSLSSTSGGGRSSGSQLAAAEGAGGVAESKSALERRRKISSSVGVTGAGPAVAPCDPEPCVIDGAGGVGGEASMGSAGGAVGVPAFATTCVVRSRAMSAARFG